MTNSSAAQETARILVAEDNDFVRMQLVKFLNEADYETAEVVSGDEAMSKILEGFDLAIVDVRMEPVGGFEFIKNMRSENITTPAVLVTGDQDPNMLNEAAKWGVAAVLIKPVQKERLLKTVEKTLALERRRKS